MNALAVFQDKEAHTKLPSVLKDPFKISKVTDISMLYWKNGSGETFHGRVEFRNGNTAGIQKFDAENFEDMFLQIKAFIESLDKT